MARNWYFNNEFNLKQLSSYIWCIKVQETKVGIVALWLSKEETLAKLLNLSRLSSLVPMVNILTSSAFLDSGKKKKKEGGGGGGKDKVRKQRHRKKEGNLFLS